VNRTSLKAAATAALTAAAVVVVTLSAPAAATAAPPGTDGCAVPLLKAAEQAMVVLEENFSAFEDAAEINGKSVATFQAITSVDDDLWLDECGKAYYQDPVADNAEQASEPSEPATAAIAGPTSTRPLSETFELQSRPGSQRTLYLDFTGDQITGSAWNSTSLPTIDAAPYSIDADTSTFSDAERTEIQRAWQIVAEDYAPFNVNVTTKDLGPDAIDRSSSADLVYGTRVIVSANPSGMQASCGCGGVAYVNVFNNSGQHTYYQPAWVYTNGVGTGGKNIAEAASHEAGHNFGLNHDGTSTSGYYGGVAPWAPIMGVGYYQPVSQWSKGEYPDANNTVQDDLAVIATGAPVVIDDHGGLSNPTALAAGQTLNGLIASSGDLDTFTFTGSGATTVAVTPAAGLPNLDVQLTIRDAQGTAVATVDPAVASVNSSQASGLDASWTATLPAGGAVYTATVDGVGTGDPLTAGKYSDYGSLGYYQVSLTTDAVQPPTTPLSVAGSNPAAATVGTPYSATPVTASGGTTPYTFVATSLPAGLSIAPATGAITGTPTTAGVFNVTVTVTDAAGASAGKAITLTVNASPYAATAVANQKFRGKVGVAESSQLVASGGDGNYSWTVASGTLPAGLTLSSSGLLSGTPTADGTYTFAAKATSAGTSATGTITVTIARKNSRTAATSGWAWMWSSTTTWTYSSTSWSSSSSSSSSSTSATSSSSSTSSSSASTAGDETLPFWLFIR
jgi:hypothetical protein